MYLHQHFLISPYSSPLVTAYHSLKGIWLSLINIALLTLTTFLVVASATFAYRTFAG